ncbi:MAG: hypothetical protein QOH41_1142, partial [Blastocatellia bacterium]|nr:hypothetical protein [Blastocatellia bacterium]
MLVLIQLNELTRKDGSRPKQKG